MVAATQQDDRSHYEPDRKTDEPEDDSESERPSCSVHLIEVTAHRCPGREHTPEADDDSEPGDDSSKVDAPREQQDEADRRKLEKKRGRMKITERGEDASAEIAVSRLFLLALLFATVAEDVMPESSIAGRLARLGLILTLTAYTTYVFLTAALAFGAATDATPETAKSLWEIRFVSETFVYFPVALLIGSVAFAVRPGLTRPWYRWGSLATAAIFLAGGAALTRNGFFAPDGGYGIILFWLLPGWVAVTGFVATPRLVTSSPAHVTG